MGRRRGATLIELLVAMAIFTLVSVATFAIMKMGTGTLYSIDSRTDVQHGLQRFEADITQELKRSSLASVGIYTSATDYRWALWMKTPMNSVLANDLPNDVTVTGQLADPVTAVTDADGNPILQRYVLYYVGMMDKGEHDSLYTNTCANAYGAPLVPETRCPHKYLIKKDIYLTDTKVAGGPDSIGLQSDPLTSGRLQRYLTDRVPQASLLTEPTTPIGAEPANVVRVQILADNVVSFEVARLRVTGAAGGAAADPNGAVILFDLKVFKSQDAAHKVAVGTQSIVTVPFTSNGVDTTAGFSSAIVNGQYAPYTVQLDNRVIPQNP